MKKLLTNISLATIFILLVYSCTKSGIENNTMNGNKIELSATQMEVGFEGENKFKIIVNSPCSWEAESKNDWLNVVTKQGIAGAKELFFYADDNYDLKKREGTIVVTNRDYGYIAELYVTQRGFEPLLQVSDTELLFDANGGSKNVYINSNAEFNISTSSNWVKCTKDANKVTISVLATTVTKNRSAHIKIEIINYNLSKIITVSQNALEPKLSVDQDIINVDGLGGEIYIGIDANVDYNIKSANWILCTQYDKEMVIKIDANIGADIRESNIVLYNDIYDISASVKIIQQKFDGEYILYYKSYDNKIVIPTTQSFDAKIIANVYSNDIGAIIFDKPLTKIGDNAFFECKTLTSITIPDSIVSMGSRAFGNCTSLSEVHIFDLLSWCKINFADSMSTPLMYAHNLYLNGERIYKLIIPTEITHINSYAFSNCHHISEITIGNNVETIGVKAFYNLKNLTKLTIGNKVQAIDRGAFSYIGTDCQYDLYILDINTWCNIEFGDYDANPIANATNIHIGNTLTEHLEIPATILEIKKWAFVSADFKSITLHENIKSIDYEALKGYYDIYCKAVNPPAIYLSDTANVYYGAFSCTWSQLKIYVPENAYNTYISFNEYQYKRGQISQYNWWKHKASIVAHNYSN